LAQGPLLESMGQVHGHTGLDFVLEGGKGVDVPSPTLGQVTFAGQNGGFGNQVKVQLQDGSEMWISHLDEIAVQPGDTIRPRAIAWKTGKYWNSAWISRRGPYSKSDCCW